MGGGDWKIFKEAEFNLLKIQVFSFRYIYPTYLFKGFVCFSAINLKFVAFKMIWFEHLGHIF